MIEFKCKNCKRCQYINNTQETNQAICTYSKGGWKQINIEDNCIYISNRNKQCQDCDRLHKDYACISHIEEDDASTCPGFIDKYEEQFNSLLFYWATNKKDYKNIVYKLLNEFETNYEFPFVEK